MECPIEPAVEVIYTRFPEFANNSGLSLLFLITAFVVLLAVVLFLAIKIKN
ncbi:MAG: hypothetical protein V3V78_00610 [Candidatus Woesearchaeota archaeon]